MKPKRSSWSRIFFKLKKDNKDKTLLYLVMMKLIQSPEMLLASMRKYMFTVPNMKKGYAAAPVLLGPAAATSYAPALSGSALSGSALSGSALSGSALSGSAAATSYAPAPAALALSGPAAATSYALVPDPKPVTAFVPKNTKPYTPIQRDKLFWCFYIILNGYEEYEMNHSNSFSVEKRIKIETVEKLKSIKEKLKELKLKRTELEDELVNKPTITIKGLCALCLVNDVSITYVYGRKYCEIGQTSVAGQTSLVKQGIIVQNERKEASLKWTSNEINNHNDFLTQIRQDYWFIENIQKPLKAPSAYTLTELQDICTKLKIATQNNVNDKLKAKTKTKLYEEITQSLY